MRNEGTDNRYPTALSTSYVHVHMLFCKYILSVSAAKNSSMVSAYRSLQTDSTRATRNNPIHEYTHSRNATSAHAHSDQTQTQKLPALALYALRSTLSTVLTDGTPLPREMRKGLIDGTPREMTGSNLSLSAGAASSSSPPHFLRNRYRIVASPANAALPTVIPTTARPDSVDGAFAHPLLLSHHRE